MIGLIFGLAFALAITFVIFFLEGSDTLFKQSYLQAHHTDIDYIFENNKLIVNSIYCLKVRGSSMNPALFEDNSVCFKEYEGGELKQGNIVHYKTNNNKTNEGFHRIIAVQEDKIFSRGDNNKAEEIINHSDVKGILVLTLYK